MERLLNRHILICFAKLNRLLEELKVKCKTSKDAMRYAKNAAALIKAESLKLDNEKQKQDKNNKQNSGQAENSRKNLSKQEGLKQLLKAGEGPSCQMDLANVSPVNWKARLRVILCRA